MYFRSVCLSDDPGVGRQQARRVVAAENFFTLKTHLPPRVYDGIHAFLTHQVSQNARKWIKLIEARRAAMKSSDRLLAGIAPVGGYRPGEHVEFKETAKRELRDVVRAAKRPIWCRILFTLVESLKPEAALELGTCVGISGSYTAAAMKGHGRLYTLEGSSDFAGVAKETMTSLKLPKNVSFVTGLFDNTLSATLSKEPKWDFVFIDGHHDGDATLRYVQAIRPLLAENAIILFDDIQWSKDMLRAWDTIVASDAFPLCMDLEEVGLCATFPSSERWMIRMGVEALRL